MTALADKVVMVTGVAKGCGKVLAEAFALDLTLIDFFDAPTISQQAALLELLRARLEPPSVAAGDVSGTL